MNRPRHEVVDEKILAYFPEGEFRTAGEVASSAGLSEADVIESIDRLESAGYTWERHPGRGIALTARSGLLLHSEVVPHLTTSHLGRPIIFFRTVASTNDLLLKEAFGRYGAGTVIATEEQTAGKGRQGRRWQAPPFQALQFSVLLQPEGEAETAALSTLTAGIAVAKGLEERSAMQADIKWPNDLTWEGGKICGILSEYSPLKRAVVIGIGLNVNQDRTGMPEGGTSVRIATGREHPRGLLLAAILNHLEREMERLGREGFEPIRREAERRSTLVGCQVTLNLGESEVTGLATGIGPLGGLMIRSPEGEKEYRIGEVVRVLQWDRRE